MNKNAVRNRTRRLYEAQGGRCYYCNTDKMYLEEDVSNLFFRANKQLRATFDHIVPAAKGGTYSIENGVCACLFCNNQKADMDFDLFVTTYNAAFARSVLVIFQPGHSRKIATSPKREKLRLKNIESTKKNTYALAWISFLLNQPVKELVSDLKAAA